MPAPGDGGGDCVRCGEETTQIGHGESVFGVRCDECGLVNVMPSEDVTGGRVYFQPPAGQETRVSDAMRQGDEPCDNHERLADRCPTCREAVEDHLDTVGGKVVLLPCGCSFDLDERDGVARVVDGVDSKEDIREESERILRTELAEAGAERVESGGAEDG